MTFPLVGSIKRLQSGPSMPFFTFKTTFQGEVTFSITQSGGNVADWYMGDGTVIFGTNEVTHTYSDPGEKTVSVAVGEASDVTNVSGISAVNGGVTEVNFVDLVSIPVAFQALLNRFKTISLPFQVNNLTIKNNNYPTEITVLVNSSATFTRVELDSNTAGLDPIIDLSNLNLSGELFSQFNAAKRILLPALNSNNFSNIRIIDIKDQGDLDLSGFTGNISILTLGSNFRGIRQMVNLDLPNLDACTTFYLGNCTELDTTLVLNNHAGLCTDTRFYRNNNNAIKDCIIDLSNFNFAGIFQSTTTSTVVNSCTNLILPSANSNNFSSFLIERIRDINALDLSVFTGVFTGLISIRGLLNCNTVNLPVNLASVSSFYFESLSLSSNLVIDNDGGNCVSLEVQGCAGTTLDLTNFTGSVRINVTSFNSLSACFQIIPPTLNTGNYSFFLLSATNQGDLDLSGFTGNFTGTFHLVGLQNLGVLTLPGSLTGVSNFSLRNTAFNLSLNLGTDIIANNINLQSCSLTTALIDGMIDKIDANVAGFSSGAKTVNFGNFNINNNQTPSAGKITLMQSISTANNFTFNYWDGAQNVTITP